MVRATLIEGDSDFKRVGLPRFEEVFNIHIMTIEEIQTALSYIN